ncbi:MAG: UDP-N-acetylmuramate:L-alanyl-gamma-D-glutamyl-meso-diaminopimelate ligase, partial [Deltaproteobacteria bacterium]|nr:UDP-N-acetylmuramate:L-alanyl-gamma-D-glutamyl-meso-diaminopimelate ligase [Deltaproteobacteria bacterium]
WIFTHARLDPSFLVGGVARNLGSPVRLGAGRHFIVEGDEYDTAFFDKVPKFVRYRPDHAILANIEFDHADIYPDLDAVKRAFAMLVDGMPEVGTLVAGVDCPNVREQIERARSRVVTFAIDREADYRAHAVRESGGRTMFDISTPDGAVNGVEMSLPGRHNVLNALAAFAMSRTLGLDAGAVCAGLASFEGVKRRQEIRGEEDGVVVIDDFAHHPTAVRVTLEALLSRWDERRLVVIFEPRTNTSRRAYFQELYASAFDAASAVVIAPVFGAESLPESERFDAHRLARDLRDRGIDATATATYDATLSESLDRLRPGDVAVLMSNGGFGGMHERLLDALRERSARS